MSKLPGPEPQPEPAGQTQKPEWIPTPCPLIGLRALRQILGISRHQLAQLVDVSREHIRKLEEVNARASGKLQIELKNILHCDLSDLYIDWYATDEEKFRKRKDEIQKSYALSVAFDLIKGAVT
jgi:DNA-binding XRE family transcriptional regulator